MDTADSQRKLAEIEITPAMTDAGVSVLCDYEPDTGVSLIDLVGRVFSAMALQSPQLPLVDNLHEATTLIG